MTDLVLSILVVVILLGTYWTIGIVFGLWAMTRPGFRDERFWTKVWLVVGSFGIGWGFALLWFIAFRGPVRVFPGSETPPESNDLQYLRGWIERIPNKRDR